jgi:hypothetical protein
MKVTGFDRNYLGNESTMNLKTFNCFLMLKITFLPSEVQQNGCLPQSIDAVPLKYSTKFLAD